LELASVAGLVENVDPVAQVGNHKEGKVLEENLVQVEGTSLEELHKACQGNQGQAGHHDPNCPVEVDKMVDIQELDQNGEEVHVAESLEGHSVENPEDLEGQQAQQAQQAGVGVAVEQEVVVVLPALGENRTVVVICSVRSKK
jgi:hypothetical protein